MKTKWIASLFVTSLLILGIPTHSFSQAHPEKINDLSIEDELAELEVFNENEHARMIDKENRMEIQRKKKLESKINRLSRKKVDRFQLCCVYFAQTYNICAEPEYSRYCSLSI